MNENNRKKIPEKEARKYQTNDEVVVVLKRGFCDWEGVYRGVLAHYFIQDGHRTLEVSLVEDLQCDEQILRRITVTKWRRSTHKRERRPIIHVDEYLEGWF